MQIRHPVFVVYLLLAGSGAASAQVAPTPPPSTTPPSRPAADCAPTRTTPQGSVAPNAAAGAQGGEPLGDKLAKSDGVLCPPSGVDPEIRAPTPETGNTPVITPPGSPGGDLSVRPK